MARKRIKAGTRRRSGKKGTLAASSPCFLLESSSPLSVSGTLEKLWYGVLLLTPDRGDRLDRWRREQKALCSRMSREDAVQKRPHLFGVFQRLVLIGARSASHLIGDRPQLRGR